MLTHDGDRKVSRPRPQTREPETRSQDPGPLVGNGQVIGPQQMLALQRSIGNRRVAHLQRVRTSRTSRLSEPSVEGVLHGHAVEGSANDALERFIAPGPGIRGRLHKGRKRTSQVVRTVASHYRNKFSGKYRQLKRALINELADMGQHDLADRLEDMMERAEEKKKGKEGWGASAVNF